MQILPFWPAAPSALWALSVLLAILVVGACWLGAVAPASAADFVWSGEAAASSTVWSNAANWTGGTAPSPSSSIGVLSFPLLNRSACLQATPSQTCYASFNNLTGLSVNTMQVDDSHSYSIGGRFDGSDVLTLGNGGLTINASEGSQGGLALTTPITLSGSQTWSVSGPPGPPASQRVIIGNTLSGETADLTINLNSIAFLELGLGIPESPSIDDEIGNLTINGPPAPLGAMSEIRLASKATLNVHDGHSLTLHNMELESSSALGAVSAENSMLIMAGSAGAVTLTHSRLLPNGLLGLSSLSLDSDSLLEAGLGLQANPNAHQISVTEAVSLGGASLSLENLLGESQAQHEAGCPPPPVGKVYTLISTSGSLSGTFGNAPDGGTVIAYCPSSFVEASPIAYFYRINYHAASSPATVTATALPAIPTLYIFPLLHIEPQLPTIAGASVAGQTLSESHGAWANNPTSYSYQWQRCDSTGNNCQPLTGASAQSYTLSAADVGATIRVSETASNAEGVSSPVMSEPTAVIQAGSANNIEPPNKPPLVVPCCDGPPLNPGQIKALLLRQLTPSAQSAKIGTLLKSGGLTMSFTAPEAGTLSVQWYELPKGAKLAKHTKPRPVLVASGKLTFAGAGTGRVKIRLTAQGKRLLRHARRVKLEARGEFRPPSGVSISETKRLVLSK